MKGQRGRVTSDLSGGGGDGTKATTASSAVAGPGATPSGAIPRRSPRLTASAGAKPRINVQQLRRQQKKAAQQQKQQQTKLQDPLAPCDAAAQRLRGGTGLIYDERLLEHRCTWDAAHVESPERLRTIYDRLERLGLVARCRWVAARPATSAELETGHSSQHVDTLRRLCQRADQTELDAAAARCDSVYLHPATYDCAALAAGSVLELTDRILDGAIQNAFAVIRPPGHHAGREECNGYSFFNHAALAARRAAAAGSRVLIVDWDVHHGQGTQRMFYEQDSVLYFSTHRYDGGAYWPHLSESDYSAVGAGAGRGLNWNVPLDGGATDADLLAVLHQLLLPAAYEFAPDLIIVSAGFDMALGDPKGGMQVTPACFGHLAHALLALASGRLLAVLEGGYNTTASSLAAASVLQVLLGDPPPPLLAQLPPPRQSVETVIRSVAAAHREQFSCFAHYATFSVLEDHVNPGERCHWPPVGVHPTAPAGPTVDPPPPGTEVVDRLNRLAIAPQPPVPTHQVSLATNELMMRHRNVQEPCHPERPERLQSILTLLSSWGLTQRCHLTPGQRRISADMLLTLHEPQHVEKMADTADMRQQELNRMADRYNSVYLCPESHDCALLAAGCVQEAVDSVLSGEALRGVCVVRPPGHHAEPDTAHGFCLYNNVALAARHAVLNHGLRRVLVVDWDVHHGNGIQHMFYSDKHVLYLSLHRHDNGFFFPTSDDGNHDRCGEDAGLGFNVNIPWNKARMGGAEYLAAVMNVVLPIAFQFAPELVLVSAGFDAARGDPLGGYMVPPEVFGHMTHHLSALAGGKIVVALEGGYNLTSISYSMGMCVRALFGDPPVKLPPLACINESAARTLRSVSASQRQHWPAVPDFSWRLPAETLDVVWKVDKQRERMETSTDGLNTAKFAAAVEGGCGDGVGVVTPRSAPADAVGRLLESLSLSERSGSEDGSKPTVTAVPLQEDILSGGSSALATDSPPKESTACNNSLNTSEKDIGSENCTGTVSGHDIGSADCCVETPSRLRAAAVAAEDKRCDAGVVDRDTSRCAAAADEEEVRLGGGAGGEEGTSGRATGRAESASGGATGGEEGALGGVAGGEEGASVGATGRDESASGGATGGEEGAAGGDDNGTAALIQALLQQDAFETMYAVVPRASCPHLGSVTEVPACGIDANMPCINCADCGENWLCLTCYEVYCGRYRRCHMVDHGQSTGHCLVLSLADLSVWCYTCEAYIHNERLIPAKRAAHRSKFGIDMPAGDMGR